MSDSNAYKAVPAPAKVSDWEGHLVRSRDTVKNGLGSVPPGTVFRISSVGITKHLETLGCPCCGFVFSVSTKAKKERFVREWEFIEMA